FEIAGRGDRKPGFDDVDPQIDQGLSEFELLGNVHAGARRLFTVAQRGVENTDGPRRHRRNGRLRGFVFGRRFIVGDGWSHGYGNWLKNFERNANAGPHTQAQGWRAPSPRWSLGFRNTNHALVGWARWPSTDWVI